MVRHNGMADTTQLKLVLDYEKLSALNLSIGEVNSAISTVLSGSYVNDYMDRGRVKQVWVMGNTGSRMQPEDILGWHVRNANGEMVPIGTFAKFEWTYGSPRLERFNGLPAVNIQGNPRAGVSSGQAMAAIEEIAGEVLPRRLRNRLERRFVPGKGRRQPGSRALRALDPRGVPLPCRPL